MILPLDLKMEFVFHDRHLTTEPGKDLEIDENDLTTAMIQNPSLFAWYASIRAFCRKRHRDLEIGERALRAQLKLAARARLLKAGNGIRGAASRDAVEDAVVLEPTLQAAQRATSQAEYEADMADAIREAFRDRREMLVNLSADRRAEMAAGVSDGGRQVVERALRGERGGR